MGRDFTKAKVGVHRRLGDSLALLKFSQAVGMSRREATGALIELWGWAIVNLAKTKYTLPLSGMSAERAAANVDERVLAVDVPFVARGAGFGFVRFDSGAIDFKNQWWKVLSYRQGLSAAQRRRIFERDGRLCRHCGSIVDLQIDHIVAVARGGSNDPSNLQVLCAPCNHRKWAH